MGRPKTDMRKINFYITSTEENEIKKYAEKLGISFAEYLRRVIDNHIEDKNNK